MFFCFLIGSVVGSFLGVVVDRFPDALAIALSRSRCDICLSQIKAADMVPLVSYLFLRGRCRVCESSIPMTYFLIEMICGVLFLALGAGVLSFVQFLFLLLSVLLSFFDLRYHGFPWMIWLGFALVMWILAPSALTDYFWLIFAFFALRFDIKIGAGDFLWLFTATFVLDFMHIVWVIQIASLLGIAYYLLKKPYEMEIPFIPFLSMGYLIVLAAGQSL